MKYWVYIIQSIEQPEHYYVGYSTDPYRRLEEHNSGKSIHTNKFKPWKILNVFGFDEKSKAIAFEKYLKSHSGRAFCKKHF